MLICTLKNIVLLPTTTTFTKYLHGKNLSLVTLMCTAQMELWEVHTHHHYHHYHYSLGYLDSGDLLRGLIFIEPLEVRDIELPKGPPMPWPQQFQMRFPR